MKILYNVLDRHAFSRNQVEVFLNGVVGDLEAKLCTHYLICGRNCGGSSANTIIFSHSIMPQ